MNIDSQDITGIILAGGQGERLGGVDKGLLELGGRPLVLHVAEHLKLQTAELIVSCNRNEGTYLNLGLKTVSDELPFTEGPVAGIVAALRQTRTPYALIASVDMPFLPDDLAESLSRGISDETPIAIIDDGAHLQYLTTLMRTDMLSAFEAALKQGVRAVRHIQQTLGVRAVRYAHPGHAFMNINTPEDLAEAGQFLAKRG